MKFGLILLGLVVVFSVAGSLIEQTQEPMYYVRKFSWYDILFKLQLDDVFHSWYFYLVTALLCLNLTFCSILRFRRVNAEKVIETAARGKAQVLLPPEGAAAVRDVLKREHCRETAEPDQKFVYTKNLFGRYGSFLTHLGILLTVIFFFFAMNLPTVTDQTCYPGESITMDDGTDIAVKDFSIEDPDGTLDYKSTINITLPDGSSSGDVTTSVNHPAKMGNYKVYQQTYGTAGVVTVTDTEGHKDVFHLEEKMFLSKDGKTGIWYNTLYPDFTQSEDGDLSLETSTSGHYKNPVYTFNLVEMKEGSDDEVEMTPMLAFPGDEVTVGDLTFTFNDPVEYPGLRIKKNPRWTNPCLGLAVLVLTLGLAILLLFEPVVVLVDGEGYHIFGNKKEGIDLQIRGELKKRGIKPLVSKKAEAIGTGTDETAATGREVNEDA